LKKSVNVCIVKKKKVTILILSQWKKERVWRREKLLINSLLINYEIIELGEEEEEEEEAVSVLFLEEEEGRREEKYGEEKAVWRSMEERNYWKERLLMKKMTL